METTNSNKLALAVLATLLGTMALGIFTNAVFAPRKAMKPGYALPAAEEAAAPAPVRRRRAWAAESPPYVLRKRSQRPPPEP